MTDPFTHRALQLALHERAIYRTMALAALDQLADANREIERQRRQLAETRDEISRYARRVFDE